ncbi:ABC transporter permease [Flavobacterium longum]|uniref:ABC transporter permease n=1 Tax=Flavobacterium longum TaxID=1299340 RepID=UPI0039EBDCE7
MNFPFYIARRYLFSFSKSNAINIITFIAAAGIVVTAAAMFIALSVFSGLREFSLSFSNDFDPDLKITTVKGKSFFVSEQQHAQILQTPGVAAYSKVIEERVLFHYDGKDKVAYLKGTDSLFGHVNDVAQSLYNGTWVKPDTYQAVIGYGIANDLSMGLFDFTNVLEAYVPKPGKGAIDNPAEAFSKTNLIPVGIYAINEDLDNKYVFADLGLVQELLRYQPNQVSALEIRLKPGADETAAIASLQKILPATEIRTRAQQNDSLYRMLNTENIAVYMVFTLFIIMALFTLIGALIMTILEKRNNLKTLLNLGASVSSLRKIFLWQGSSLTILGGVVGLMIGIAVVVVQQRFQLVMITESLAYPVRFTFGNVLAVLVTIAAVGMLASWFAAWRVNRKFLD